MHVLAVNSVSTLLTYLTEQLQNTPILTEIQSYNVFKEDKKKDDEEIKQNERKGDTVTNLDVILNIVIY